MTNPTASQTSQDDNEDIVFNEPNEPPTQGEILADIAEDLESEPRYNLRKD